MTPDSPRRGALLQNVLAKALYDNVAESPDELSFRKGDIMTVLERNTQGLDGWWLCSLHGRQGIVPGNRLKILVGMYDKKQQQQQQQQAAGLGQGQAPPVPQPTLPYHHQGGYSPLSPASQYTPMHPSYVPQGDNVYLMPAPGKGQQGLYSGSAPTGQFPPAPAKQPPAYPKQTPPHAFPSAGQEIYQVPPALSQAADAYPVGSASPPQDIYQVPPSVAQAQDIYQVPPSLDARSWEGSKPSGKVRRGSGCSGGWVLWGWELLGLRSVVWAYGGGGGDGPDPASKRGHRAPVPRGQGTPLLESIPQPPVAATHHIAPRCGQGPGHILRASAGPSVPKLISRSPFPFAQGGRAGWALSLAEARCYK